MEGKNDDVKAIIYTPQFKVEGSIHLLFRDSYRGRLSDHLNSSRTPLFIPITDAKIFDIKGNKVMDSTCIILNRNRIEAVIELEES